MKVCDWFKLFTISGYWQILRWVWPGFAWGVFLCPFGLYSQFDSQIEINKFHPFEIEIYDSYDGLSQSTGYSFMQDSLGFVWVGTEYGINRFDGISFKAVKPAADNPEGIPPDDVFAMTEENNGLFWLGFRQSGLGLYNAQTEEIQLFKADNTRPNSLSNGEISSLQKSNAGIWAGTANGLNLIKRKDGKVQFRHFLNNHKITCLTIWGDSTILIGTDRGLYTANLSLLVVHPWEELPEAIGHHAHISAISVLADQSIVTGIEKEGLWEYEFATKHWKKIESFPYQQFNDIKYGLGNLWITGDWGMGYYDLKDGMWKQLSNISTIKGYTFFEDRFNNLFWGTDFFVLRLRLAGKGILNNSSERASKVYDSRVYYKNSIEQLWVGTKRGLLVLDKRMLKGELTYEEIHLPEASTIRGVNSILEERGKGMWIGHS